MQIMFLHQCDQLRQATNGRMESEAQHKKKKRKTPLDFVLHYERPNFILEYRVGMSVS